jgi:hypothetical protein
LSTPSVNPNEEDEFYPQYNPVTANSNLVSFSSEDEWLFLHSIVEDTIFNPATSAVIGEVDNDRD